jgi:hypothetical protein
MFSTHLCGQYAITSRVVMANPNVAGDGRDEKNKSCQQCQLDMHATDRMRLGIIEPLPLRCSAAAQIFL